MHTPKIFFLCLKERDVRISKSERQWPWPLDMQCFWLKFYNLASSHNRLDYASLLKWHAFAWCDHFFYLHARTTNLAMVRLIGSFLADSNVPQPGNCISGHTLLLPAPNPVDIPPRSSLPFFTSNKAVSIHHLAFIFPLWKERQATPPCPSAASIPSAFYVSFPPYHCESLPLQPLL